MAAYVFNTTRTLTSGTELQALASGDSIFLGRSAFWSAPLNAARVLTLTQNDSVVIAGQLFADGIAIQGTQTHNTIDLTDSAIVISDDDAAIDLAAGNHRVTNAGYVSGLYGIRLVAGAITNTGIISTERDGVTFALNDFTSNTIINSGTITSGYYGVVLGGVDDALVNTGTISGILGSVRVTGFRAAITNSGTIDGTISVSGTGDSRIVNTGVISGGAIMGAGNDFVDTTLGTMNFVFGGDGDDTIYGSALRDRLEGGRGDDVIAGNGGNDLLIAGAGADVFEGGEGRDTVDYAIGNIDAGVLVDLVAPELGTGLAAGDTYESIEIIGGSFFADALYGDATANILAGENGNDILDGREGADRLIGGDGNDSFYVDNRGDRVIERTGAGFDTVFAAISYTAPENVENATLMGTAAINAVGNALGNVLVGNAAANILDGKGGSDGLTGGAGADQFRFTTALDAATNADIVLDFTTAQDKLVLSRAIFTAALGNAAGLSAATFVTGTAAGDANDRFIYDTVSGKLYYDPDGSGAAVQTLFATLQGAPALAASDFILFAG